MTDVNFSIEDAQSLNTEKKLKIVKIAGQLDESNVDQEIQVVYKLMEENPNNMDLIFDLENLEYMNSKSIGYMTDLYGKIREHNGKITIAKAKPNIKDILQVVGLTQLIPIFDTIEEAKTALIQFEVPVQPVAPIAPSVPMTPVAPSVPMTPVAPSVPMTPMAPSVPITPVQPTAPVDQSIPIAPVTPIESENLESTETQKNDNGTQYTFG